MKRRSRSTSAIVKPNSIRSFRITWNSKPKNDSGPVCLLSRPGARRGRSSAIRQWCAKTSGRRGVGDGSNVSGSTLV
jgi:hypothetical protein